MANNRKLKMVEPSDRVVEFLEEAIQTRIERNAEYSDGYYGGAYIQHGHVVKALFPHGTPAGIHPMDINRMMNLNIIIGKLVRYCANFEDGGHDDSMKDIAVYSQIQRELDELFLANGAEE
jgi:hypothetical protein